jgi:hypothetical protein
MATKDPLGDILELADLFRPAWDEISDGIPAWHPRAEGDPDPDPDPDSDPDPDPDPAGGGDIDWKSMARKHEREAKKARKQAEEAAARLKEREDADKSEHEKAIEQARDEARKEALTQAEKDRRADRLEIAVTRLAAKGITVGDGDDKKTLKFADPEDAQVFIERALNRGDLDEDDIFDTDGKVQTDAVTTALADLLERKPNLAAGDNGNGGGRPDPGDPDAGKGSGGAKDLESLSVDEHLARKNK